MLTLSYDDLCTVCQDDDVARYAVTWCTVCEVFLCQECTKHHRKSRLYNCHNTMSTEDYHKLPAFMKDISSQCKFHNKEIELYCSVHTCPCCVQCVSKHQKCQDMKPLSDILFDAKSSVHLLETKLENAKQNYEMILNDLKIRIDKNDFQNKEAIEEIRSTRESIDDSLNILEQQFLGDLECKYSNLKSNLNLLVKNIKHWTVKIHKLQDEFLDMIQQATEFQMYIGLREIEKTISEVDKYIEDLISGGHLNKNNLEIKISPALQSSVHDLESFGEINIVTRSTAFPLLAGGNNLTPHIAPTFHKTDKNKLLVKTLTASDEVEPINIDDCRISAYDNIETMTSSSCSKLCSFCQADDVASQSVTRCTECEVFLCQKCEKHHRKARLFKHHKTMSTKDFHKLPVFMQETSSLCKEHNSKLELYCPFHACPCCIQCLSKHRKCQDIKPLSDMITHVRSSASIHIFKTELKDLTKTFGVILNFLNSRIDENNSQMASSVTKFRCIKKSIDDDLNRLEQKIMDELESKHLFLISNMNTLLKQIKHREIQRNKLQEQLSKLKQFATNLQMYFGLREIEMSTSEVVKFVSDFTSGDHMNESNLEIRISSSIQLMLQDIKSFGEINITTCPSSIYIQTGRRDQAQHFIPTIPEIEQIEPLLLKTVTIPDDIKAEDVKACQILPNGEILILDQTNKHISKFSNDGILMKIVVRVNVVPYDMCLVRNDTVAISLPVTNQTVMADIEKGEISETIGFTHDCHGLSSDGQILVVSSVNEKKCTTVNLIDMSPKILEGVGGNYISLFKENMYCIDNKENNVNCYNKNGDTLWTFKHCDIQSSNGLALDIHGFIYIASFGNKKIVVISPDGKASKTIQSEADGIINPRGIDINKDNRTMIIACEINNDRPHILIFKI